jgi:hypothetical protein
MIQFYEDAAFLAWLAGRKLRDEVIVGSPSAMTSATSPRRGLGTRVVS